MMEGYTLLEYIESDGTNFIDTGILGKSGLQIKCRCSFNDVTSVHNVFGVLEGTNRLFVQYDNAEGLMYAYGAWNDTNVIITANEAYEMDAVFNIGSQSFKLNGVEVYSGTSSTNISTSLNAYLFALNLNGTPNFKAKMRLYYCRIYDNGSLVRDYIPCQSSEGYYGLYDKVTNVFYQSVSEYGFTGKWEEDKKLLVSPSEFRRRLMVLAVNDTTPDYTILDAYGVAIMDIKGRFYPDADLWRTAGSPTPNGVAVSDGVHRFCIATYDAEDNYWGSYKTLVNGVHTAIDSNTAKQDFDGISNTDAIVTNVNSSDGYFTQYPWSAAGICKDYIFPNGKRGYLAAAGEWNLVQGSIKAINTLLDAIGERIETSSYDSSNYWSSTQYDGARAWCQYFRYGYCDIYNKKNRRCIRPFCSL